MPVIIITKGLPGSGKTTWAKKMQSKYPTKYIRINKDDLRAMLHNNTSNADSVRTTKTEAFVSKIRYMIIDAALAEGNNIIIDDTNLDTACELKIRKLVGERAKIKIKSFTNIPLEECLSRNKQRERIVKEDIIRDMNEKFLKKSSF